MSQKRQDGLFLKHDLDRERPKDAVVARGPYLPYDGVLKVVWVRGKCNRGVNESPDTSFRGKQQDAQFFALTAENRASI